ncbi:protein kinase [Hortaea werneckii]|nr:protein kinase [Hortaea werneckii]KAI6837325.1 protein kinase [Hortaea werneckii]KAI6931445.1 protein kinase [Hortaea werneckii]KAI6936043.1 protein kinase [Hortaea werneckii]KAI6971032.1 protein kinase [Hortaea werneckii]
MAQRLAQESPGLVLDALGRAVADFKACLVRKAVERVDPLIDFRPSEVLEAGKTVALFIRGHIGLPTSMSGVIFEMSVIDAHILAVANIAPAYAFEVGKPYTSAQLRHLPMILAAIHATLRAVMRSDISGGMHSPGWLINSLKASVDARLRQQGASLESSGFEGKEAEGAAIGLDTVLQYIVYVLHSDGLLRLYTQRTVRYMSHLAIQPRTFPSTGFPLLPTDTKFEEERLPGYKAEEYYPVHLGEVFQSRYQVLAKLGYGTASTVWLQDEMLALKVCIIGLRESQEVAISRHIKSVDAEHHPGKAHLRVALEDFEVEGPCGRDQCLVFPCLGRRLSEMRDMFHGGALDKTMLQRYLCGHRIQIRSLPSLKPKLDISPNNVLVAADNTAISKVEEAELAEPSPRKVLADRTIHLSYTMPNYIQTTGQKHSGDVMPGVFRAPEVIAGMEWDSQIDIWSVGVMIWNLLEDGNLFQPFKDGHLDDEVHFAQMVSLMGPPPKQFLERSDRCRKYWDAEGNWIAATSIPDQTLETREMRLTGDDRDLLLALVRKILRWLPEERPSAGGLYEDEFILQFMKKPKSSV